jgi:hypothetical protein
MSERKLPTNTEELIEAVKEGHYTAHELVDFARNDEDFKAVLQGAMEDHSEEFDSYREAQGRELFRGAVKQLGITVAGIEAATDSEIEQIQMVGEVGPYILDVRVQPIHNLNADEYKSMRERVEAEGGLPAFGLDVGSSIIN